jgi:hypothetical protein
MATETSVATIQLPSSAWSAELYLRAEGAANGAYGLILAAGDRRQLAACIDVASRALILTAEAGEPERLPLPGDLDPMSYQRLGLVVDGRQVTLELGPYRLPWQGRLAGEVDHLSLATWSQPAAFAGFTLAAGWRQLFEEEGQPADWGWQALEGEWRIWGLELRWEGPSGRGLIVKGPAFADYDLVVNARSVAEAGRYTFWPALSGSDDQEASPAVMLEGQTGQWALRVGSERWGLPATFDPYDHQHFRFGKRAGRLAVWWEMTYLGEAAAPAAPTTIGLGGHGGAVAFEMARLTALLPIQGA